MGEQQPLTWDQLVRQYQWDRFPDSIQKRLYAHYGTFTYEGDLSLAERDIQSVSVALSWVMQGARLAAFLKDLKEHHRWFGDASTGDLANMARQLVALRPMSNQSSS